MITRVLMLIAWGCPVVAIVVAFGPDARTIWGWLEAVGHPCQRVHQARVEQERALDHVQADELWVKRQGGSSEIAMALQGQTHLWLGGVIGAQRDKRLIGGSSVRWNKGKPDWV